MKYLSALLLLGAAPVGGPCLIIGDEIAHGISSFKPECAAMTRPESSSMTLQNIKPSRSYPKVVISVGTNGYLNPHLGQNLFAIRKKFPASSVTWIAPRNRRAEEAVYETAVHFHDRIIYLNKIRPNGSLRAKDYKAVAKQL